MKKIAVFGFLFLANFTFQYVENKCQAQDSALRDRLLTEAPRKWDEYRVRGKHLQGTCLVKAKFLPEYPNEVRTHREYKQNGAGASYLNQPLAGGPDKTGKLWVVNSRYGFRLQRSASDSPWAMAGVNLHLDEGYKLGPIPPDLSVRLLVDQPFAFSMVWYEYLPDLMKNPDFSVKKVTSVPSEGSELVRVEFANRPRDEPPYTFNRSEMPSRWNGRSGGWILLDPAHYWVIREFSSSGVNKATRSESLSKSRFEYKIGQDGFPILARIHTRITGVNSQGLSTEETSTQEFDLSERPDVPDSDFTLSAYGFPEPVGLESRSRLLLYVWFALAGVICLAAGALYRWWSKRRGSGVKTPA